jgi:anti-anti-sigma factor
MNKRFSGLDIERVDVGGRLTLMLGGELDVASAPTLHRTIAEICGDEPAPMAITLDLSGLVFIDSTGLAEIILTSKLCDRDGHDFTLIRGPRSVQRLFELTGLIDALPFQPAANATE